MGQVTTVHNDATWSVAWPGLGEVTEAFTWGITFQRAQRLSDQDKSYLSVVF